MMYLCAMIMSLVSFVGGAVKSAPTQLAALSTHESGVVMAAEEVTLVSAAETVALAPTPPPAPPEAPVPAPIPDGKYGLSVVGSVTMETVQFQAMVTGTPGADDPEAVQVRIDSENAGTFEVEVLSAVVQGVAAQIAGVPGIHLTNFPIGLRLGPLHVEALVTSVYHDVETATTTPDYVAPILGP